MNKIKDYIENCYIYDNTWLMYRLYSSNNYRICLPNGVLIILNEKENYMHTNKTDYMFQVFIQPGHCIYCLKNLKVDKKRLKYVIIEDYLDKLFKKDEKVHFLDIKTSGGEM